MLPLLIALVLVAVVAAYFLFANKQGVVPKLDDGGDDEGNEPAPKLPAKSTPPADDAGKGPPKSERRPRRDGAEPAPPSKSTPKAEPKAEAKTPASKAEPKAEAKTPASKAEPKAEAKTPAKVVPEPVRDDTAAPSSEVPGSIVVPRSIRTVVESEAAEPEIVDVPMTSIRPPPAPSKANRATKPTRPKDVEGLRRGLAKARAEEGFFGRLKALFVGKKEIDPRIVDQLEEVLLTSDVGVATTERVLAHVRERLGRKELSDEGKVWEAVGDQMRDILSIGGGGIALVAKPTVVLVVGVNGVGKTTTIGKLATRLKGEGKTVVLAAGDTFRAAAADQLGIWGKRIGCEVVRGKEGASSGSVIFDAVQKAKASGADVVLADTAGRLHTKANLMDEIAKVARSLGKAMDGAPHETLLVLDATTGQNAIQQTALFKEALPLSGLVLTKMDGTAKGGVILGVCAEHQVPVRYVGIGERADDLRDFSADEFVEALLGDGGR
jgi:fused signal recognition particle receptor